VVARVAAALRRARDFAARHWRQEALAVEQLAQSVARPPRN